MNARPGPEARTCRPSSAATSALLHDNGVTKPAQLRKAASCQVRKYTTRFRSSRLRQVSDRNGGRSKDHPSDLNEYTINIYYMGCRTDIFASCLALVSERLPFRGLLISISDRLHAKPRPVLGEDAPCS